MTESDTHATQMPRWQDFMIPTLRALSDGAAWARRDLVAAVLDEAGISAEQRSVILNSGKPMAEDRIGWAISGLTRATAISRPARGQSVITAVGRELLNKYPNGLDKAQLQEIAAYRDYRPRAVQAGRPPGMMRPLNAAKTCLRRNKSRMVSAGSIPRSEMNCWSGYGRATLISLNKLSSTYCSRWDTAAPSSGAKELAEAATAESTA